MLNTFQLEIITPTKIYTEGQVSYVRAESSQGKFGVMAKHASATIEMSIGEIKVVKDGKIFYYATNGGFADIRPESVQLIVETAELISDIDRGRAEEALGRAKAKLKDDGVDLDRAKKAIARATNRIKITSKI